MENNVTSARYIYTSLSHVFSIPVPSLYESDYYFTSRYRYCYTFSRLCLLTELRKATHHTTCRTKQRHIRNFPTRYPIRYLLRNAYQHSPTRHQPHRSRSLTSTWVLTRLFFYSRQSLQIHLVFHISSFTYTTLYILQIRSLSTARRRRTRTRTARRTTIAHHRILSHTVRCRQFRTTSPSAQHNNSA